MSQSTPKSMLYRTQLLFMIVSVVPLAVLAYLCARYVIPILSEQGKGTVILSVYLTIGFTVMLSVLGYILTRKGTMETIGAVEGINRQLNSLLEVADELSRTNELDTALAVTTKSAVRILKADVGVIYLATGAKLICKLAEGVEISEPAKFCYDTGEGIVGEAAKTRRPGRVLDAAKDDRFVDKLGPLTELKTGSVVAYPMVHQERLVGVLELVRRTGGAAFSDNDQQMLEILGQQATATILTAEFSASQQNYFAHVIELLRLSMENDIVWEGHLHNVARICNMISRKLELDEETRRTIHFAAMLHDIGFLKMRDIVGHVDVEGFSEKIRDHTTLGSLLVEPITVWQDVAPLILYHHELCNGTGYPKGIKREVIPLGARIICVAEVYDAMTNDKAYGITKTKEEAAAELKAAAGTKYDPDVVKALLDVLGEV
jgi:HD-GYP domain-containing protein (c-di-GMP phosphodiesterase class II)